MKKGFLIALVLVFGFGGVCIGAQDFGFGSADDSGGFGFGDDSSGGGFSGAPAGGVNISGDVSAEIKGFYSEMDSLDEIEAIQVGDIFSGSLNFSASGSAADAVFNLKLKPVFDGAESPLSIDEAFVRAYFGPVNLEAGIRKLTWGKADSHGPLDVINPLDYSDLSAMSDPQSIKIARPLLHASWTMGTFSKLEAVFVPWFKGHTFSFDGKWAPGQVTSLASQLAMSPTTITSVLKSIYKDYDKTLRSAQAGLRFTTTLGSNDLGFQYYFGKLPRPAFRVNIATTIPTPFITYNYYHQIGVDYARVLAGFNIRAEAGANITNDLDGTDGTIYNPAILWSLGFDRDLFLGINLNLQCNESVRLFQDKVGDNPLTDVEAGSDMTSTRITAVLSKKFFRDELELKTTAIWGIEDMDCYIIPAIAWSKNDITAELSAGFFAGEKDGELGQYRDNGYIKAALTYSF
jgi:hypothetical protein